MTNQPTQVLARIDAEIETSIGRWMDLLRFPTIATDPAHNADCRKAADWLLGYFAEIGFAAKLYETTGQPAVIATYEPPAAKGPVPHILFYGHYDVQPVDPLDLWESPPFEPRRGVNRAGKPCVYARGAADDKGQFLTFTEACRQWLAVNGSLPCRLTVLIEGDEEGDSSHLDRFVAANKNLLKADVAVVCDTGMWDEKTPSLITSLRGCIAEEVTVTGPAIDLHSGYYGGPATNPLKALSNALGRLFDAKGRIAIPGFYDGIRTPSPKERARTARIPFSTREFLGQVGLRKAAGEQQFSPVEQMWIRPTAEINGIWGGYTGPGGKTVIPSQAHAKLTFRTVAGQNPAHLRRVFRAFIRKHMPKDCKVAFNSDGGDNKAVSVSSEGPWMAAAARALKAEWGKSPVMAGEGGSIPVVDSFKRHLKLDTVLMGFCHDDDGFHSPNEKYDIESYHRGIRSYARFISELAKD